MKTLLMFSVSLFAGGLVQGQLKWTNVDSLYSPLPGSMHVYRTNDSLDGKPNIAYYVVADLKNKRLEFTADTSRDRRLTPQKFYERNNHSLLVVNCTFFSYETDRSINTVIKNGKLVGYNIHSIPGRGKDTLTYGHPLGSAIGISKKRKADVAWLFTDSARKYPIAFEWNPELLRDSSGRISKYNFVPELHHYPKREKRRGIHEIWKMKTAVGGGPVLLQKGEIRITNNEELKFTGKAIDDKHPRTAMGYTRDNKLILLVIQGRFPGIAEGATLLQEAEILKNLGCWEALNLDGGGSSCMLMNGRETIKPSDKEGQRPVPAVFIINGR